MFAFPRRARDDGGSAIEEKERRSGFTDFKLIEKSGESSQLQVSAGITLS